MPSDSREASLNARASARQSVMGLAGLLLSLLQLACGGGSTGPSIVDLLVTGDAPRSAGRTSQLRAVSVTEIGSRIDVTTSAAWRSNRPEVATVSPTGVVTARAGGQVSIVATYEGAEGSLALTIPERLFIVLDDPVGDSAGRVDVTAFVMDFDAATGEYAIEILAESPQPFVGWLSVNINMLNADLGTRAHDPAFFQDTWNHSHFPEPSTSLTLTGVEPRLTQWQAGNRVALSSTPFGNPEGSSFFACAVGDWPRPPGTRFGEYLDFIALGQWTTIQRR